jgi:hypothetical protein
MIEIIGGIFLAVFILGTLWGMYKVMQANDEVDKYGGR